MYQVLQVFTSFSFSLIDIFLSRSIKVGQALSRRCRKLAETSPQSRGDVVSTFSQSPWSPVSLGDIAETSPSSIVHYSVATNVSIEW